MRCGRYRCQCIMRGRPYKDANTEASTNRKDDPQGYTQRRPLIRTASLLISPRVKRRRCHHATSQSRRSGRNRRLSTAEACPRQETVPKCWRRRFDSGCIGDVCHPAASRLSTTGIRAVRCCKQSNGYLDLLPKRRSSYFSFEFGEIVWGSNGAVRHLQGSFPL